MRWLFVAFALTACSARATASHQPPVLTAHGWEARSVQEPNVWHQGHRWHMIFSGGWDRMAVGHATAPTIDGPWTQDPDPILGLGHGRWAGTAREPSVLVDRGRIYVYFSPTTEPGSPHACDLMVATGPDVHHLHVLPRPALRPFGDARAIVNVSVVRDGVYRMMFESRIADAGTWAIGYAEGRTPVSFTPVRFPVVGLSHGGAFGGPDLHRTPHGWNLLYHAAPYSTLPTDIYRATSTDLVHWTPGPHMVTHPSGSDQAADPYLAGHRLFYSVMDNPQQHGGVYAAHTSMIAGP